MESAREIPAVPAWHEGAELANRDRNIVGLPRSGLRVMCILVPTMIGSWRAFVVDDGQPYAGWSRGRKRGSGRPTCYAAATAGLLVPVASRTLYRTPSVRASGARPSAPQSQLHPLKT